jgi:hypothetical protein
MSTFLMQDRTKNKIINYKNVLHINTVPQHKVNQQFDVILNTLFSFLLWSYGVVSQNYGVYIMHSRENIQEMQSNCNKICM